MYCFLIEQCVTEERGCRFLELHSSSNEWEHSPSILKAFFARHSSEYETSDNDRKVTFHTLTSVDKKGFLEL